MNVLSHGVSFERKKITLTDTKKTPASRNMPRVKPLAKSAAINRASVIKIIAIVDVFLILMCNVKSFPLTHKFSNRKIYNAFQCTGVD